MNRSFYAVPAMLCLAAAVVTAQAPAERPAAPAADQPAAQQPTTPRPTTPARPAQASAAAANKVTYTGCVKPGTATDSWILENAEVAQRAGASASAPSTVGTSGTSKMTFNLDPAATVNLKAHANHKVEVVGLLSPARADASSASAAGDNSAPRQQFSVESLKMVSATCP